MSEQEPIYTIPEPDWKPEFVIDAQHLLDLGEDRDWGHTPLGLTELHDKGIQGDGVKVAVLDTGADDKHEDLKYVVKDELCKDFTHSPYGWRDVQSHGTHCSGIVAADNQGSGLVGTAPNADIVIKKVLGDSGSGSSAGIAAGIREAADDGVDIISMSLGSPYPDRASQDAIRYAISKGCWVVAASGNSGRNTINYPGAYPEVICVGAVDRNLNLANFSSTNQELDICAPGVSVLSTVPGQRFAAYSGTSMATPYVAGCLALVRGELKKRKLPIPSQAEIMTAMKKTARDLGPQGPDHGYGAGLIQPAALIEYLVPNTPPVPPLPPEPDPIHTVTIPAGVKEFRVVLA